jgi:hypothetical protein
VFAYCLALAAGVAAAPTAIAQNTLTAAKAAQSPRLESLATDAAWTKAPELQVSLGNGSNFKNGATTARLKATYTADTFYLLIQYADPTQSIRRSPFVKQPDGSWKMLADPDDKGGTTISITRIRSRSSGPSADRSRASINRAASPSATRARASRSETSTRRPKVSSAICGI